MRSHILRLAVIAISMATLAALSVVPQPGFSQNDANLSGVVPFQEGGRDMSTSDQRAAALADTNQQQQSKGSCSG